MRKRRSSPRTSKNARDRRLRCERLEDRRMLALYLVSSLDDSGEGSLRTAIELTNSSPGADTIEFAPNLSAGRIELSSGEMEITDELTIDARALAENVTIDANQLSRIFNITATSGNFTLGGLTLTGGKTTGDNASGAETSFSGGAIRSLTTGDLLIERSSITGNITSGDQARGGGVFSSGSLTLVNSVVSSNSTAGYGAYGGGIRSTFVVTLTNSIVENNHTTGRGANGGGIHCPQGAVTLNRSTVRGNSTSGEDAEGGGIEGFGVSLTDSAVEGNGTTGNGSTGGGISSYEGVVLTRSTVNGNSTQGDDAQGGGIRTLGNVVLSESNISGNSTAGSNSVGGATWSWGAIITRSTVSGNSTAGVNSHGGGIYAYGGNINSGPITITQSTIVDNHATHAASLGGGIFQRDRPFNFSFSISGSILHGNTAGAVDNELVKDPGSTLSVNYSLIGEAPLGMVGVGNITGLDPMLGPLANNGGPTMTHALLAGSPALDSGDPSIVFNSAQFDQRGGPFVRVVDGDVIPGGRVDIGAYERQTVANLNLVVDSAVDENDGNYSAGDFSLREAIGLANGSVGENTITFDASLSNETITLGGTELVIGEAVAIDARPLEENVIIDADGKSRIFNITATTGDFTLGGLTLTRGHTSNLDSDGRGGAVLSLSSINLEQCIVSDSQTVGQNAKGGGIFVNDHVRITQSIVSGNSTSGEDASGGGIYAFGSVVLIESTVSGNSTSGEDASGGGIRAIGEIVLSASTVSGNTTSGDQAEGGGMQGNGLLTAISSTISGNSTSGIEASGGGVATDLLTIYDSTISGNITTGEAASGGGILVFGPVILIRSTITGNKVMHASARGGGLYQPDLNFNSLTHYISNSIMADNSAAGGGPDILPDPDSMLTVNYSLIGHAPAGIVGIGNITGFDPLLGPLADNGGPTMTHALLEGSAAIDAGDPAFAPPPDYDQRGVGFDRVVGGRVDMGAFELQAPPVPGDFDHDGDVDGRDFLLWQRGSSPVPLSSGDLDSWRDNYGTSQLSVVNGQLLEESQELRAEGREPSISGSGLLTLSSGLKRETASVLGSRGHHAVDGGNDGRYFEQVDRALEQLSATSSGVRSFGEMVARRGMRTPHPTLSPEDWGEGTTR